MKKAWILALPVMLVALALCTPARSRDFRSHYKISSANTLNESACARREVPPDSADAVKRGKTVYKAYCLSCHQFDGGGVENLNPPLIKTPFVLGNKERFIQIILKGFDKRVEIDGEQYSNNMPSLNFLTNQQIADVMTYVRNDFGNKATLVRPAEVQAVRAHLAQ